MILLLLVFSFLQRMQTLVAHWELSYRFLGNATPTLVYRKINFKCLSTTALYKTSVGLQKFRSEKHSTSYF